jgi:voltage-gated potassium channel
LNSRSRRSGPIARRITDIGAQVSDRQIALLAAFFLLILAGGTLGFVLIERWSWFDSFYMTVVTVSTVGFAETHPLSAGGRVFAIGLILSGVATLLYSIGLVGEYIVAGHLGGLLGLRRMEREIKGLADHYIVCGFGRTGRTAADQLASRDLRIVVVDQSEEAIGEAIERGFPAVHGDAGTDEVLRRAGIERAAGLVASTAPDAQTLLVVLSGRALNRQLNIVARAERADMVPKLRTAGANRIVSLYEIAGHRIAHMVSHPEVTEFLDILLHDRELELEIDEVEVGPDSAFKGITIDEARSMEHSGANIVAIRRSGQSTTSLVSPDTRIAEGDVLIALGTRAQLTELTTSSD